MDGFVIKTGQIFKAGSYPDKDLTVTPEELKAMATNFVPVPNDLDHKTTLSKLDSKLGQLLEVWPEDNGNSLFGKVAVPTWLNEVIGKDEHGNETPIKVSCTIRKKDKKIAKLAFTDNPRVSDASIFAAFSEANPDDELEISVGELNANGDEVNIPGGEIEMAKKKKANTYDGLYLLQLLHDKMAAGGAVCGPGPNPVVAMHAKHEVNALQQMHDITVDNGAKCRFLKDGEVVPTYFNEEKTMETKEVNKPVEEQIPMSVFSKMVAFFSAQPKETTLVEGKIEKTDDKSGDKTVELSGEAQDKFAALEKQLNEANEALKILQAENERVHEENVVAQASKFADDMIKAGKEIPANREICVATFAQAVRDDEANAVEVNFSADKKGSRVDAIKALYESRKAVELTKEQLDAEATTVLLSNEKPATKTDVEKIKERAFKLAEKINKKGRK